MNVTTKSGMAGAEQPRGRTRRRPAAAAALAASATALLAMASMGTAAQAVQPGSGSGKGIPQLTAAMPGSLEACEDLVGFAYDATVITVAEHVPAGALTNAGEDVGEHCLVQGHMNERVSEFDGRTYAIGFEMRLPVDWSGRYLYQANGGLDGNVATATGTFTGGQLENGLQMGFAVLSSDAGHTGSQIPVFGFEPQARLDYGYQAVGTLTPMAKALITEAYGRGPDRSYIAGGSNGGRHTMVASARYADQYDGFLAIAPGFNLPQAAVAQIWGAQQWATVATDTADLSTALTQDERELVAQAIIDRCDGLDRLRDGQVLDTVRCQHLFSLDADVPTCDGDRDGTCLTEDQKAVIRTVFAGATTSDGEEIYSSFPLDPGITQGSWGFWKFIASVDLDPLAVGTVFGTPPAHIAAPLALDIDQAAAAIYATTEVYTESGMEFATPPDPTNLDTLRDRGAKMIVVHGTADGVFSSDDTAAWYEELDAEYRQKADQFVRYFEVPAMGHVRGGPATDQFDGLGALVAWVEQGDAPDRIVATARGEGNPGGANAEVPAEWSVDRSRPLCPYPLVARYVSGDPEDASSFACKPSGGGRGTA
ncbi:tannase/feruloyl esterase family alpha/beta hydrolase [Demequina pelophila]|uniref:tannase/feruloyl esterase family alpha/beta hydrolase n=1 Tax=Demequina pelophila TaxID=1638984 RepID=UPI000B069388|nr:tannase/feruloyl esterase family alpha/beta hydrolase [Demequina pelophila]